MTHILRDVSAEQKGLSATRSVAGCPATSRGKIWSPCGGSSPEEMGHPSPAKGNRQQSDHLQSEAGFLPFFVPEYTPPLLLFNYFGCLWELRITNRPYRSDIPFRDNIPSFVVSLGA